MPSFSPRTPRYSNDTYQPVAEAARQTPGGVDIHFRGPDAKGRARYWQQQFGIWRAKPHNAVYHGLTTQRRRGEDDTHWITTVLTHQDAHAKFEVTAAGTDRPIDLNAFDDVLSARREGVDGALLGNVEDALASLDDVEDPFATPENDR